MYRKSADETRWADQYGDTDMITTLAAVRLIPIPPALVDSRKTGMLSSSVNSSTNVCRKSTEVEPVNIRYFVPLLLKILVRISRIWVNCMEVRS